MNRKRLFVFVLLVMLTLFNVPSFAQDLPDATPEPAPVDVTTVVEPVETVISDNPVEIIRDQNPILLIVLAVVSVLLALLTGGFIFLARQAYNALPPWAAELLLQNRGYIEGRVDAGFDYLDIEAGKTSNPLDDMLVRFGRTQVEQWISAFYEPSVPQGAATPKQSLGQDLTPDG